MRLHADVSSTPNVPALAELQARPQWVCWRKEQRQGKLTKVPYDAITGRRAEANNPQTWTSYAQAVQALHTGTYHGIGYMFQRDYTGIDLDHCVSEDGRIESWAQAYLDRLPSYAEYSPSETGIHILVRGTIPSGTRRPMPDAPHPKATIEMYCERRYFTVTGQQVEGTPTAIEACQELLAIHAEITATKEQLPTEEPSQAAVSLSISDAELLERARQAGHGAGARFAALYAGTTSDYGHDASRSDAALCSYLAFWTGRDADRMDRLFRGAGLMRAKWESKRGASTYGRETIQKAMAYCHVVYQPHRTPEQLERDIAHVLERIAHEQPRLQGKHAPAPLTPRPVDLSRVLTYLGMNEYGDALFFAEVFAHQICYDHTAGEWYLWNGHAWRPDTTGKVRQLVAGVLGTLYLRVAADLNTEQAELALRIQDVQKHRQKEAEIELLNEKEKQLAAQMGELASRAKALRGAKRNANVLTFVQSEMGITSELWDTHPWLLAVPNGVIDLRSGQCRQGEPSDYLRTVCPTAWTGIETPCPRFERFLQEIFEDKPDKEREELIAFLQRLLGYGITGSVEHHLFPILYGEEGRNGKDTLLDTLKSVLGPLVGAVSNDVFVSQDKLRAGGAPTPHLCDLQGKRLVWGSETKQGDKFNIAQIKLLTGGGAISTRQLHGKQYSFTPTHKLLLMTNYKPHADARDKAFWSRACLIEFGIRFVDRTEAVNERRADLHLKDSLRQERSGILAWIVRGCLAWQEQGLAIPPFILLATEKYRDEEDKVLQFIRECCTIRPDVYVKAGALYTAYKDWCEENQFGHGMNATLFGNDISRRFEKRRTKAGMIYQGIGLLASDETGVGLVSPPQEPYTSSENPSEANSQNLQASEGVGCVGFRQVFAPNDSRDSHREKNPEKPYTPYTQPICDIPAEGPSEADPGRSEEPTQPYTNPTPAGFQRLGQVGTHDKEWEVFFL